MDLIHIKELLRDLTVEQPAHITVISLVRHPDTDRHNESQLLSERDLIREHLRGGGAERHLVLLLIYLEPRRHP